MEHWIPLLRDHAGNLEGALIIHTTKGSFVVFGSSAHERQRFSEVIAPVLERQGKQLGFAAWEGKSIEEAKPELLKAFPTEATFVPFSAPIVTQVLNEYRAQ